MNATPRSALAVLALTGAACGTSSSSGTTGGSCATETQPCTALASCCAGLSCSTALGICLTAPGSNGSPSSGTATTATNTTGATGSHSSTTSGLVGTSTTGSVTGTHSSTSGFSGTVSGTTSGFTGTVSSTTSGSSGSSGYAGGCAASDYFSTEYFSCGDGGSTVCGCGQICTNDSNTTLQAIEGGDTFCETPCSASSECPDPASFCSGGVCRLNTCSPIDTSCSGGYCVPYDYGDQEIDLCVAPGSLQRGATCQSLAFANDPSSNCANGQLCLVAGGEATCTCDTACNPEVSNGICGTETCVSLDATVTDIGECAVVDAGVGVDAGYAGGCDVITYYLTELMPCADGGTTICTCGQVCTVDTNAALVSTFGASDAYCETHCATSADCPDPATACVGGACTFQTCSPIDTTCSKGGGANGFCQPTDYYQVSVESDVCVLNGTAGSGAACAFALGNDLVDNCASGLLCLSAGFCATICNPSVSSGTCGTGSCISADSTISDLGYCTDGGF